MSEPYTPSPYRPAEVFWPDMTPLQKVSSTGLHVIYPDQWSSAGQPLTEEAKEIADRVEADWPWWESKDEEETTE